MESRRFRLSRLPEEERRRDTAWVLPTRDRRIPEWGIPLAYAGIAVLLGVSLPQVELRWWPGLASRISASAAMALDASVACGTIALTGIAAPLVFIMVQFAAMAYSPHIVPWIARDRLTMHGIGVFTATVLYAVTGLAWVDRHASGHVPLVSTWPVIGMLVASVAVLLGIIRRFSLLQVNTVLATMAERGRRQIEMLYPALDFAAAPASTGELERLPVTQVLLKAGKPQTIQAFDTQSLIAAAYEAGAIIRIVSAVGDTVGEGMVLLRVYGGRSRINERVLMRAIRFGDGRTSVQDPKYAIHVLVDMAIRALSPAINDPSTAVQALDQIEDLLLRLGRRRLDIGAFRDRNGLLRLVIPVPSWEDYLTLALEEIRHSAAGSVLVMRRMSALLGDLIEALPAERRPGLLKEQDRLKAAISRSFDDDDELLLASMEDRQGLGAPRRSVSKH